MKKNSIEDYLGLAVVKVFGPILRTLPLGFGLFLGRRVGNLFYFLDLKHRCQAYVNIKRALGSEFTPGQLKRTTRKFFRCFGQNIIEVFFIPLLNHRYMEKYITIENRESLDKALAKGKGVLLLGMHAGSWELTNVVWANMGFTFHVLYADQKLPRLARYLNTLRASKGCNLVQRTQVRTIVRALKNNEVVGITVDQGGRTGELVKFFGRNASMSTGAVKLALKYDSVIVPGYYARIKGPHIRVVLEPPFEVIKTNDPEKDVHDNLQRLAAIYEKDIRKYPHEYMWNYRIWKYSDEKEILIISDGKAGHLRQSQAAAVLLSEALAQKGIKSSVSTVEAKLKNRFAKMMLSVGAFFSGKHSCQGCLTCLRSSLEADSRKVLSKISPDFVISCGSLSSMVNRMVSRENMSKSIAILKPAFLGFRKFDLVVMPRHDNPPDRKNVAAIEGALNLINKDYLKEQAAKLINDIGQGVKVKDERKRIGLLIGGDTKNFKLDKNDILQVLSQVKKQAESIDADILVTTSRRTPVEIEKLVKDELSSYGRCKLLIVANEKNIPEAVGGILGLSDIVIVSAESISMVSEAASSAKYVIVLEAGVDPKHRRFLKNMADKKYIYLTDTQGVAQMIAFLAANKPQIYILNDRDTVKQALSGLI